MNEHKTEHEPTLPNPVYRRLVGSEGRIQDDYKNGKPLFSQGEIQELADDGKTALSKKRSFRTKYDDR